MDHHTFASEFFGSLFTGSGKWNATLTGEAFEFFPEGGEKTAIPYERIYGARSFDGVLWSQVTIECAGETIQFGGISNGRAATLTGLLQSRILASLLDSIDREREPIAELARSFKRLLGNGHYLANHDVATWVRHQTERMGDTVRLILAAARNPQLSASRLETGMQEQLNMLMDAFQGKPSMLAERNLKFIDAEMDAHKVFFENVETTPLTDEQRRAAIVMEDRNLLVAAAGSGKTSTVVGKVGYALLREYVTPEQILVLAFNNHAANELQERINKRLAALLKGSTVKVKTFHALGLEIIAEVENAKPMVAAFAGDPGGALKLIDELIGHLIETDKSFATDWLSFRCIFLRPASDPAEFSTTSQWDQYVRETGDYVDQRNGYRTLNGELVKSQGELAIANWLYMNGVSYEYEKPYQYSTADKHHRQYQPDFFFPDVGCYLEHYALDALGRPPQAFGYKYRQSMEWKRALHVEKGTDVFETYFSEFVSGRLFPKLEAELTARGVKLRPRSTDEILKRINQHQGPQANEFYGLLLTFMKHAKSNQMSLKALEAAAHGHSQVARATLFVRLVGKILDQYARKLRELASVDFEDMIINAARYSNEGQYRHSYRLILVDEFQDISQARANLLSGLLIHAPDCRMFAVGDDWQSIYRFAGSDISLFTSFEGKFGVAATNYLTKTFRSNQGIAHVAARFVQNNPAQIRKSVVAIDPSTRNVISVLRVERRQDVRGHISACLIEIAKAARAANMVRSVFFLARYRHQRPENMAEWREQFAGTLTFDFRTIHASKGLQSDYVILLGLQAGKHGFPSVIADDPLLKLVMPMPETYPHAEERRLFYVALTRARHGVFLLASKFSPSVFMEELERDAEGSAMLRYPATEGGNGTAAPVEKCPECRRGHLMVRSGRHGEFWGCSEYPACRFTRNMAAKSDIHRAGRHARSIS